MRTDAVVGVEMDVRGEHRRDEILSNKQARDNWSSSNTKIEAIRSSQPVHVEDAVSKSLKGDDETRLVKIYSCWCGDNFTTMSSYAKHVNLHARGEYKPGRSEEEKQEEETSAVLVSNEKERRPGKGPTFVQKKESVRGAVGMDQELEAAVKRMDLVSKTSTTSDTFMTAKSCQESDRE